MNYELSILKSLFLQVPPVFFQIVRGGLFFWKVVCQYCSPETPFFPFLFFTLQSFLQSPFCLQALFLFKTFRWPRGGPTLPVAQFCLVSTTNPLFNYGGAPQISHNMCYGLGNERTFFFSLVFFFHQNPPNRTKTPPTSDTGKYPITFFWKGKEFKMTSGGFVSPRMERPQQGFLPGFFCFSLGPLASLKSPILYLCVLRVLFLGPPLF